MTKEIFFSQYYKIDVDKWMKKINSLFFARFTEYFSFGPSWELTCTVDGNHFNLRRIEIKKKKKTILLKFVSRDEFSII